MHQLPETFKSRMKQYLNKDYESFIKTYEQSHTQGLRVNTLKLTTDQFLSLSPFHLQVVPWTAEGFYYQEEDRPGKHPYHAAGLYYIQEPSAMAVTEVLDPQPGEKILDLSAAPGGKSTHIVTKMKDKGLLVANEIHPTRVKALSENLERFGAKHILVTNESPNHLAKIFPEYFDRILVDAPCSGEGMFRKNPEAIAEWSESHVQYCAIRQQDILDEAQKMLKPGGTLVYSTCTFAPEENEGTIARFIDKYPQFEIEPIPDTLAGLFKSGEPKWVENDDSSKLQFTLRLWPHHIQGEGHFIAKLRKKESTVEATFKPMKVKSLPEAVQYYRSFAKEHLSEVAEGIFHSFGDHLYLVPDGLPDLKGIKVERLGLHLGELKKKRFEPSHALAMALSKNHVRQFLPLNLEQAEKYLRGETLQVESNQTGWTLVTIDAYPLGWGKISNHQLKNHYPKGLRWK
ncbi:RsmF rRNA methyltransferase first C-terminal domain-containing protein [Tepidibacillus decaturensis]|uniref:SAM-dependent MTase RsmB/NOP-type domain-containing protein n=1 Tax=Tepidibacillus decaturensis TaxID=1413211 RepID=A0A135L4Z1_9BACI|nr:RsmF rRNA methyltransferase first C-terminal domain-containing protein [Tepidibacillus decaturensis]KXG44074.1 hypothetical protein U473_08690 [Tepidibacillus decaturensis]